MCWAPLFGRKSELVRAEATQEGGPRNQTASRTENQQQASTRVETTNYAVLYVRYTIPTSNLVQETIAILSPDAPLGSAFAFVVQASRPPNRLQRWAAKHGPDASDVIKVHPSHASRRNRLRALATGARPLTRWDFLPVSIPAVMELFSLPTPVTMAK